MAPPSGKPRPQLLFTRNYAAALRKAGVAFKQIESQTMTNVVLLATLPRGPGAAAKHAATYRGSSPAHINTHSRLAALSHEPPRTATTHYRASVGKGAGVGKYLVFGTGNIIRAGKHTHADAVANTAELVGALKRAGALHPAAYPAVMSCPNTVITGKFKDGVSKEKLEEDWRVNSTKRFPGRSVSIKDSKIVPEIYASDGRFIMPGVSSPEQLLHASKVVDDVAVQARAAQ